MIVRSLIFEDGNINMPVEETEGTREEVSFVRLVGVALQNNIRASDLAHAAEVFVGSSARSAWLLSISTRLAPRPVRMLVGRVARHREVCLHIS
jgi:hypothetical protein